MKKQISFSILYLKTHTQIKTESRPLRNDSTHKETLRSQIEHHLKSTNINIKKSRSKGFDLFAENSRWILRLCINLDTLTSDRLVIVVAGVTNGDM